MTLPRGVHVSWAAFLLSERLSLSVRGFQQGGKDLSEGHLLIESSGVARGHRRGLSHGADRACSLHSADRSQFLIELEQVWIYRGNCSCRQFAGVASLQLICLVGMTYCLSSM